MDQLKSFIYGDSFFQYHGLVLTGLWIIGCTFGILLKRVNLYLHALAFFLIDVTTLYFIVGAWLRVYPSLDSFNTWSTLKKGHVIGGSIFTLFLIIQHLGGVTTLLGTKHNPVHKKFAFVVTNLARIVAYFGWLLGSYHDKEKMANYVLIAAVVLFILSLFSVISGGSKQIEQKEETKQVIRGQKVKKN